MMSRLRKYLPYGSELPLKDVTQLFRLTVTKSGNDATPIDPYNKILTNVLSGINVHVTLIAIDNAK